jgi:SAM-dependent methyltransferase
VSGCRLCGASSIQAVGTFVSHQTGAPYTLYACDACLSELFDPDEHPVDLESLYASEKPSEVYRRFRRVLLWSHEARLLQRLSVRPVRSVLDFGCRTGDFLMHWPSGVRKVGVELSAPAAQVARERGLAVVQGPIEQYIPEEPFDVVTLYAVLEHLARPLTMLERLPQLVAPQGVVAILIPTHQSLKQRLLTRLGRRWHMYNPPLHLSFLSYQLLDSLMQALGFQLAGRRYTSGGMVDPFARVPLVRSAWRRGMHVVDAHTGLNRLPVFDHLYSYYVRS